MQALSREEFHRVDAQAMLPELRRQVTALRDDLRQRSEELQDVHARLTREHQQATQDGRTAATFAQWREDYLTQVAVAWMLGCVFLRYLEDNALIDKVWLTGPGERALQARDHHQAYFRAHPTLTEREYLEEAFRSLQPLPGCQDLFGTGNPLWLLGPSGDRARALVEFWQQVEPGSGKLLRAFGPEAAGSRPTDTRFLGDLYQDLSEDAKKRYALLQTPEFVEEFILDQTLTPAMAEFGLEDTTLLDPACGSGHFLLGAFHRLFSAWRAKRPGEPPSESARRALGAVYGVDLNPFAVAIARFRLLIAALQAAELPRLAALPGNFAVHVVSGDSLLHGGRLVSRADGTKAYATEGFLSTEWAPEPYARGDYEEACRVLSRGYAVVVGNPPYIVDRDKAHNEATRARYPDSCYRQFALAAPFTERFFELASPNLSGRPAGYVGCITTNAFMKREYGKKLIEVVLPRFDLSHVIDTSGAYIPGHGTPTVILLGRHRSAVRSEIRAVMGIRGEPSTPANPAEGLVWTSILSFLDQPGSANQFLSVSDVTRDVFQRHPWSIGGGGAAELKTRLEQTAGSRVSDQVEPPIGRAVRIAEEDVYIFEQVRKSHSRISDSDFRAFLFGEAVRDWTSNTQLCVWYPYAKRPVESTALQELWHWKTLLANRSTFQGNMSDAGLDWFDYMQHTVSAYTTPLSIAFAFVSTHNHFVLDRGGKVFNRSAPVIKLPPGATEDDHLALLGVLNSSTACFWMKQVCHNKGATSDRGILQDDPEKFRFEFDGTKLLKAPIPKGHREVIRLAACLDNAGTALGTFDFKDYLDSLLREHGLTRAALDRKIEERDELRCRMVRWQEELDFLVYELFGLLDAQSDMRSLAWSVSPESMPPLDPQDRPYRWRDTETSPPSTQESIDQARLRGVASNQWLDLLERPEYKRRWFRSAGAYDANNLDDETLLQRAMLEWLLDRLESPAYWPDLTVTSCARLAERARRDPEFVQVAELYAGQEADLTALVTELATGEAVPYLAGYRYTESGLRKRADWEQTWDLQRKEDAGEKVGAIPVPPKYATPDFTQGSYWRLRGKLDVPKERFLSYPNAEREADPTPVLGWAGWNHLQQAQALATCYLERLEHEGWPTERLEPLLAGVVELLPWLKQWHNEVDPETGERLGDFYAAFADTQARQLGTTVEKLRSWRAPEKPKGRAKRKSK